MVKFVFYKVQQRISESHCIAGWTVESRGRGWTKFGISGCIKFEQRSQRKWQLHFHSQDSDAIWPVACCFAFWPHTRLATQSLIPARFPIIIVFKLRQRRMYVDSLVTSPPIYFTSKTATERRRASQIRQRPYRVQILTSAWRIALRLFSPFHGFRMKLKFWLKKFQLKFQSDAAINSSKRKMIINCTKNILHTVISSAWIF